jgi:hypothetical protein
VAQALFHLIFKYLINIFGIYFTRP